jgi:hypothetical protein
LRRQPDKGGGAHDPWQRRQDEDRRMRQRGAHEQGERNRANRIAADLERARMAADDVARGRVVGDGTTTGSSAAKSATASAHTFPLNAITAAATARIVQKIARRPRELTPRPSPSDHN